MYIIIDLYARSTFPVPMACLSPFGTTKAFRNKVEVDLAEKQEKGA